MTLKLTLNLRWAVTAGAVILVGVLTMGYVLFLPGGWKAEAVVAFAPKSAVIAGDLLELTADKYVAYLGSDALQRRLASKGKDPSVQVTRDAETANVRIAVTLEHAAEAVAFANALAGAAVQKSAAEKAAVADVISPAETGAAQQTPQRAPYLLAGLLLALIAGGLTWYATGERRTR